jgi:hypothetical protein
MAIAQETERTKALEGTPLGELKPYSYVARGFYYIQLTNFMQFFDRSQLAVFTFEELCETPAVLLKEIYRRLGVATEWQPPRLDIVENRSVPDGAKMDPAVRRRLVDVYSEDVQSLGKLLHRDFPAWLK